jgi:hypothetical protein
MFEKAAGRGFAKDSSIMPSVTVQIPMPPGAAQPAQPSTSAPANSSSAPVSPTSNTGQR